MILLIDAFNLIYKFPELEEQMHRGELVQARRGLLALLLRFKAAWKKPLAFHVFFDGKKKSGDETRRETVSGLETYFSADLSADHLIKEFVNRAASTGEIMVVTSDKDILHHVKKHRCQTRTSEEFAKWVEETLEPLPEVTPEKDPSAKLSAAEVDEWLQMFRERQ